MWHNLIMISFQSKHNVLSLQIFTLLYIFCVWITAYSTHNGLIESRRGFTRLLVVLVQACWFPEQRSGALIDGQPDWETRWGWIPFLCLTPSPSSYPLSLETEWWALGVKTKPYETGFSTWFPRWCDVVVVVVPVQYIAMRLPGCFYVLAKMMSVNLNTLLCSC